MAAQENHLDVVRYLLENGGNQSTATEVKNSSASKIVYRMLNFEKKQKTQLMLKIFCLCQNADCLHTVTNTNP